MCGGDSDWQVRAHLGARGSNLHPLHTWVPHLPVWSHAGSSWNLYTLVVSVYVLLVVSVYVLLVVSVYVLLVVSVYVLLVVLVCWLCWCKKVRDARQANADSD